MDFNCFRQTLTESTSEKLTHLQHAEELIFDSGIKGIDIITNILQSFVDMFAGKSAKKLKISVKIDGSPSLIAGLNPENGRFFVATKSAFAKTPKLCYSPRDIENYYGEQPGLAEKMLVALRELPKLGIRGILQGDLLFTKSDLRVKTIGGESYLTFKPNTIVYAVPTDSDLAATIKQANLGICFHTTYTGNTIANLKMNPGANIPKLRSVPSVWLHKSTYLDLSGVATFTAQETKFLNSSIASLARAAEQIDQATMNELVYDSDIHPLLKIFINANVKAGVEIANTKGIVADFIQYVTARYEAEIEALKSDRGRLGRQQKLQRIIKSINDSAPTLRKMFELHNTVIRCKNMIVAKLNRIQSLGTFLETPDGYEVTGQEGFCCVDSSGNTVKLVDRLTFSRANFNRDR